MSYNSREYIFHLFIAFSSNEYKSAVRFESSGLITFLIDSIRISLDKTTKLNFPVVVFVTLFFILISLATVYFK